MQIQGYCDPAFVAVQNAFAAQFAGHNPQHGGAVCVMLGGETVVDLWAGVRDQAGTLPWQADTLVSLYSCTKTFTGVAALQLVAEGRLELDGPVSRIWPEFGCNGKSGITLRQLLCHRAGVAALHQPLAAGAVFDWETMVDVLAGESPWWAPGQAQGYAPLTYGWLLGEIIRRADGQEPGQAIVQRVARPLGLDFHLGLSGADRPRVAWLSRGRNDFGDEAAQRLMRAINREPASLTGQAFNNPPGLMGWGNRPEWQTFVQPAANGYATARALAGFYAGLLQGRLLDPALLREMTREHSLGEDLTLRAHTRFGLGCWLDQPLANATFAMGAHSFGHPGAGGCLGFADPERELAFGYITNTLGPYVLMDPRAQALARAARDSLA